MGPTTGCRSEPAVGPTDLGSEIGKQRPRLLNRGDYDALNPSQVLSGDPLGEHVPAGDHPGRSGSPFRHELFYLRCSQAGPRNGKLRDEGMGLPAPTAPYPQQREAVPVVVLAIRAMPDKAIGGAAAGTGDVLGPFFPGVFRHRKTIVRGENVD